MPTLKKSAQTTLKQCLALKKNESLLIITDRNKKKIAKALFYEGAKICHNCLYVGIPEGKVNGEEPPKGVADIMKKFDVIIGVTTKSLTHTIAVKNAMKNARIATMPDITEQIFRRTMSLDYKKISEISSRLGKAIRNKKEIRIKTKKGTDISLKADKPIHYNNGFLLERGDMGNLPAGEVFFAPKYRSAEGIFIVDASMAGAGRLDRPIKITVKKGYAVKIEGGKSAAQLKKILKRCGKSAYNIAELGIGTNHKAKITGCILEDEKVLGTAHIALGNNKGFGGKVYAKCHLDGVFRKPTIYADGKIIIKEGRFMFS